MLYKCKQTNGTNALYCQGSQPWTFLFGLDMNVAIYAKIPSARGRGMDPEQRLVLMTVHRLCNSLTKDKLLWLANHEPPR